jgi:hypothetical protein
VGVLVTISVFALLVILAYGLNSSEEAELADSGNQLPSAASLRAQEKEVLTTYAWIDQEKGTVRIPVDVATDLVIEELNQ